MASTSTTIDSLTDTWLRVGILFSTIVFLPKPAAADEPVSPLQTVMDGRDAAADSILTEDGIRDGSQTLVNSVMAICGALAVMLVAFGLYQLYIAQEEQNMMGTSDDRKRAAWWSIGLGSLISIPAIIAAILPFNILGVAG